MGVPLTFHRTVRKCGNKLSEKNVECIHLSEANFIVAWVCHGNDDEIHDKYHLVNSHVIHHEFTYTR